MGSNNIPDTGFIGAVWGKKSQAGKIYWKGRIRHPEILTDDGEFEIVMYKSDSQNKKAPDFVFKQLRKVGDN